MIRIYMGGYISETLVQDCASRHEMHWIPYSAICTDQATADHPKPNVSCSYFATNDQIIFLCEHQSVVRLKGHRPVIMCCCVPPVL